MSAVNKQLPDDTEALKKIIEQQASRIAALEETLRLQKLKKFGASSGKPPDQYEMFNEAELPMVVEEYLCESEAESAQAEPKTPKAKRGRKPLPADLPHVRIEHDLSEPEKQCPCGHERTVIGETSSEQLDIIPAQVRELVNVRKNTPALSVKTVSKTRPCRRSRFLKATRVPDYWRTL